MADAKIKCLVVGAGPVGALAALYAARRGWDVEVYELRGDLRDASITPLNFTRSINLALSDRGIAAMRQSGSASLLDDVLASTIPMHARMVHGSSGNGGHLTEDSQAYDVHGRFLRAVDRGQLNKTLLDALDALPNVRLLFHHKLTGADLNTRKAWFENRQQPLPSASARPREVEVPFDLILGCDGAHSSVRYHMMKFARMDFSQSYIDSLWCEFTIPADTTTPTPTHRISPHHLHIWPSPAPNTLFIAIPSLDHTFTCTLFAPTTTFITLSADPSLLPEFFTTHFPGALPLIGSPATLTSQFTTNPHLPLQTIKCSPHHFAAAAVILGDAAHAMVPFYGQGMNAGLEDVQTLFSHLDAHFQTSSGRAAALAAYTASRVPDAHAIADLALGNYWEMRAGVKSRVYLLRKKVEEFLADRVPGSGFATQYARVSFSGQRYSEVVRDVGWQRLILLRAMFGFGVVAAGFAGGMAWWGRSGLRKVVRG